jgi:hypothetical protein
MHGDRLADLWNGSVAATVAWDEHGAANTGEAWTGSMAAGTGDPEYTVGNSRTTFAAWCGDPEATGEAWMAHLRPPLNTILHVYALSEELVVPLRGDFDGDGDVDGNDFLDWQRGLGTRHTAADLTAWRNDFGARVAATTSSVPEPITSTGFAMATIFLATRRGRSFA